MTTSMRIAAYLKTLKKGDHVCNQELLHLGSRASIDICLHRLNREGVLHRLTYGLYQYVMYDARVIPSFRKMAELKARAFNKKVMAAGQTLARAFRLIPSLDDDLKKVRTTELAELPALYGIDTDEKRYFLEQLAIDNRKKLAQEKIKAEEREKAAEDLGACDKPFSHRIIDPAIDYSEITFFSGQGPSRFFSLDKKIYIKIKRISAKKARAFRQTGGYWMNLAQTLGSGFFDAFDKELLGCVPVRSDFREGIIKLIPQMPQWLSESISERRFWPLKRDHKNPRLKIIDLPPSMEPIPKMALSDLYSKYALKSSIPDFDEFY